MNAETETDCGLEEDSKVYLDCAEMSIRPRALLWERFSLPPFQRTQPTWVGHARRPWGVPRQQRKCAARSRTQHPNTQLTTPVLQGNNTHDDKT